MIIGQISI